MPAVKQHHGRDEQMLSFALLAAAARVPGVAPAHGALARWSSLTTALWAVALFAVRRGAAAGAVLVRGR